MYFYLSPSSQFENTNYFLRIVSSLTCLQSNGNFQRIADHIAWPAVRKPSLGLCECGELGSGLVSSRGKQGHPPHDVLLGSSRKVGVGVELWRGHHSSTKLWDSRLISESQGPHLSSRANDRNPIWNSQDFMWIKLHVYIALWKCKSIMIIITTISSSSSIKYISYRNKNRLTDIENRLVVAKGEGR